MIHRILKMLAALGAGIGITLATQFLLPPAFLHYCGVDRYGEWIVLSATLGYLGTLNFGITTYSSNELTILRKRGEMERYRELQGSTLALLLGMISLGTVLSAVVFFVPLASILHLKTMTGTETSVTAFFLGLQTMAHILGGYYNNLFMVVEESHRGLTWYNARRLSATAVALPLVMMRLPFSTVAIGQFAAVLLIAILTIYDLRRKLGNLPLGLGGANWKTAKETLAPSGMFGMIFIQQFLVFQVPVVILQRLLGPEVVVLFNISRTILGTARQSLQVITNAIAPEITFSYSDGDMKRLLNIFHYSEIVVFAVIPIANLGAFLFSPILLEVWLHKPGLFDTYTYGLMALISGAMSMREHKQFFQFSTNTHKRLSLIVFFGNIIMIAASIPITMKFGLYGFLAVWLASEVTQMGLLYHENKKLFRYDASINLLPIVKLTMVMVVSLPLCAWLNYVARQRSLMVLGAAALVGVLFLIAESSFVFGLTDVWFLFKSRLGRTVVRDELAECEVARGIEPGL